MGANIPVEICASDFDAILLAGGAEHPRDLPVPGRELKGIHFAMEFLPQQNRRSEGDTVPEIEAILATGKRVVIIGGGDTGADCLGTSHRQGALSVTQFELLPKPPDERSPATPWPLWPLQLRIESSHEEGGLRDWSFPPPASPATTKATCSNCTPCGSARRRSSSRIPAPSSRWMPTWCCWPWASPAREATA